MNRTFELIWLRIREYFKHPVEEIRQADPIVPGRLYKNFGYVCKAVPMSERELEYINGRGSFGMPVELLGDIRPGEDVVNRLYQLHQLPDIPASDIPARCNFCDFYRTGIPCPFYNLLDDGSVACETHKYIILKKPI